MNYNRTVWRDGNTPAIDAAHLNKIEEGIVAAANEINNMDAANISWTSYYTEEPLSQETTVAGALDTANMELGQLWNALSLIKSLPVSPSSNGTYRLRLVVNNGNSTYSWVAE